MNSCFKPDFIDLISCQTFYSRVSAHLKYTDLNILNYDKPLPVTESRKCYVSLTVAENAKPSSIESWISGVLYFSCVQK